ncbi:MAG: ParA family protein, partial [Thermoanaerobaculia bacterium]|nr:ParA family protein [Thermoanaerobaculia bacterium]
MTQEDLRAPDPAARRAALITAFVSKKGGVGKTTTTVNLAAALALSGRRVLLVDLDPNAGASLSLGASKHELGLSAADVLLNDRPAIEAVRPTGTSNLDLIPGSVDLRSVETDLVRTQTKELVLRRALDPLRARYDFIMIDCPSSLGLLTRNALAACDGYVVPAVPQFLAIEGIEPLVDAAERLRYRCRSRTVFLGIVPTLVDHRSKATRQTLDALRERFGQRVFAMEIRVNVRLAEAPAFGNTIFEYNPDSTGARAYRLLAEELLLAWER